MPVPWRSGIDGDSARLHAPERRVELGGIEQRAVAGQQGAALGSEREGADDSKGRGLGVAAIVGSRITSSGGPGAPGMREGDPLGASLAGDHDHPLDRLGGRDRDQDVARASP